MYVCVYAQVSMKLNECKMDGHALPKHDIERLATVDGEAAVENLGDLSNSL